jgi:hypothetical protein
MRRDVLRYGIFKLKMFLPLLVLWVRPCDGSPTNERRIIFHFTDGMQRDVLQCGVFKVENVLFVCW